jgi:hypothetical protein
MKEQFEALQGNRGSQLLVVDTSNGKIQAGAKMESVPVFDGMAAAYGNVYVSMVDGTLRCLARSGEDLDPIPEASIAGYNADAPISNKSNKTQEERSKKKRNRGTP